MMLSRRRALGALTGGAIVPGLAPRRPDQYQRPSGLSGAAGFPSSAARREPLVLQQNTGTTFPAGVGVTVFNQAFSGVSYQVSLDFLTVNFPAPPTTTPFAKVSMIWKDQQGGTTLGIQHWFLLITNVSPASNNTLVVGRGPAESGFLQVIIKNLDTADVTGDFMLIQSGLPQATRHDWRSVSNNILNSYAFAGIQPWSTPISDEPNNILGYGNAINIGATLQVARINGLYAGEAQLCVEMNVSVALVITMLTVQPEFTFPMAPLYDATTTATKFVADLTLTRSPSIILLTNTDAATPVLVTYSLVPKEFAS